MKSRVRLHNRFNIPSLNVIRSEGAKTMYSAWIKVDESLPWIELKETFQSKSDAQAAMKTKRSQVKIKIVLVSKAEAKTKSQKP